LLAASAGVIGIVLLAAIMLSQPLEIEFHVQNLDAQDATGFLRLQSDQGVELANVSFLARSGEAFVAFERALPRGNYTLRVLLDDGRWEAGWVVVTAVQGDVWVIIRATTISIVQDVS